MIEYSKISKIERLFSYYFVNQVTSNIKKIDCIKAFKRFDHEKYGSLSLQDLVQAFSYHNIDID